MKRSQRTPQAGARVLVLLLACSLADASTAEPDEDGATFSLILENDSFISSDRNYTSGFELFFLSGADRAPAPARWIADALLRADREDRIYAGIGVGQSIFTPDDVELSTPPPDQHPYAGWLYLTLSVLVDSGRTLDTLVLEAGIVGPDSGAAWVQESFHDWLGATEPHGWDHQLENEFGAVLSYDRKWRTLAEWQPDGLGVDVTPNLGFSVGNVLTAAAAGLTFRLGEGLRGDYGPPRIRPSLAGSRFFQRRDDLSWYVFAGVTGRAVAYNIFLDGNAFRDGGPSVERRPFVAEGQAGLVLQIGRWQAAFSVIAQTEEFETQEGDQVFGAISLSYKL